MKQDTGKTPKKLKQPLSRKGSKPACGTLSYMAECRGALQRGAAVRWSAPPDSSGNIMRK